MEVYKINKNASTIEKRTLGFLTAYLSYPSLPLERLICRCQHMLAGRKLRLKDTNSRMIALSSLLTTDAPGRDSSICSLGVVIRD